MSKKTRIARDVIDNVEIWGTVAAGLSVVILSADPDRIIFSAAVMIAWVFLVLIGSIVARNIVVHFEVKEMSKKDAEERQARVRASIRSDRGEREEYEDEDGNQVIQYYRQG